ncbi:MAG TPA: S8 family serine peptidase [Acidimicrobiales bacterium]|nr:S8 family serine peptidase [Acidimicrobiales bacterium]
MNRNTERPPTPTPSAGARLRTKVVVIGALALGAAQAALAFGAPGALAASSDHAKYIVESTSGADPTPNIESVGGQVSRRLDLINGAVTDLGSGDAASLASQPGIVVVPDAPVMAESVGWHADSTASGTRILDSVFPQVTGATKLWGSDDKGAGQAVAVLDTGVNASLPDLSGRVVDGVDLSGENNPYSDGYGHGTFVAGLIASDGASSGGQYMGEAPAADLVSVKVAGASGATDEATVIAGIGWTIAHQGQDHIGVLNISLGTVPVTSTRVNPLDQAVEMAWKAGITVVTAAGNSGPANGTITSPGDDPLVITAGALADSDSTDSANWSIPSFSSVGPTLEDGWFKPDLVAPGRSVVGLADPGSDAYVNNPSALVGTGNFVGSGTSFAAAITSGMAALVLGANHNLTPDDVKARLLLTATPGPLGNPFVDGHGVGNAYGAATVKTVHLDQRPAAAAEALWPGAPVPLFATWTVSSWNGAGWNGAGWNGAGWNGAGWNGAGWNGAGWNGAGWNGAGWNGAGWNGAGWNGAGWNGAGWNGAGWNGAGWNGAGWNGAGWNGAAWNGAGWNGAGWNGAAWNGASWNGAGWNGAGWNGAGWNGAGWNGTAWDGSSWNGAGWNGAGWNGAGWNGAGWNGAGWNGSSWN